MLGEHYTKEQIEQLVEGTKMGLTDRAIGKRIGRTWESVRQKRLGMRLLKLKRFTPDDMAKLREYHMAGLNDEEIAKLLGSTKQYIYKLRWKHKIARNKK